MDYTIHGILQARILEWVSLSLLQGIFPIQGWNPGLLYCRRILYQLSHQGSEPTVAVSGGYSLVVTCGLLISVASLVAELRL